MNIISPLITRIKTERQAIADAMVNGNCINFESYQRLVGQSIGLQQALDFIDLILEEEDKDVE
jgi:hypothetical protein